MYDLQLNEVWNLVLACKECNRWQDGGKAGNLPQKKFLDRLHHRNEYLIESNHPLKENIILATGKMVKDRIDFLLKRYEFACTIRKPSWEPKDVFGDVF